MSLQEPVLRAAVVEFFWPDAPRFPDVRGQLIERMRAVTEDDEAWHGDQKMVGTWNDERRLHLIVSGGGVTVVSEDPERIDLIDVAAAILAGVMHELNVAEVTTIRTACTWLLAAESREAAAASIERRLGAGDLRDSFAPLGGRPDDLVLTYYFNSRAETQTSLRIVSMEREEFADSGDFITDFEEDELPPAAALIEARRRHRGHVPNPATALENAARHVESIRGAGERFIATLRTSK